MPIALGTRVLCKFGGGEQEFPGTISACYSDSTYAVDYDDGDSEDRVDRALIRPLPAAAAVSHPHNAGDAEVLEQAKEENRTLRKQIAQMISLSQEEDAETEQLMQSMNAGLSDARQTIVEKDAEIERVKRSLTELTKAHKNLQQQQSKVPNSSQIYQQTEELRAELKKARDGEASARRLMQQAKSELSGRAAEQVAAAEDTIQQLQEEMNELREGFEDSLTQLESAMRSKSEVESELAEEKHRAAESSAAHHAERGELLGKLKQAEESAEEWARRHKEMQALSDQAYEIMKNEIAAKDEQLVEMHTANARLTRSQHMLHQQQHAMVGGQHEQQQHLDGEGGSAAAQQPPPPPLVDGLVSNNLDRKKVQQSERAAARAAAELVREKARFESELERTKAALAKATKEKAELSVVAERNAEAAQRQSEHVKVLTEQHAALTRQQKQQQEEESTSNKPKSKGGSSSRGEVASPTSSSKEEKLSKEVKMWKRKHRELSDLSDEAYAIMSEQLREKDEALALMRKQIQAAAAAGGGSGSGAALADTTNTSSSSSTAKQQQQQQDQPVLKPLLSPVAEQAGGGGEEEEDEDNSNCEASGSDAVARRVNAVPPSSPQATSELAASLNKLKQKWNNPGSENDSPEAVVVVSSSLDASSSSEAADSSLFSTFLSPSQKKQQQQQQQHGSGGSEGGDRGDATTEEGGSEGGSPAAHAARAAALHLAALEKEVADAHERESELREELVKARAEVRRLRAVIQGGGGEGESNGGGEDGAVQQRGWCGASDVGAEGSGGDGSGDGGSAAVSFEEVKKKMRELSHALMNGDESADTHAQYSKWEAVMAAHPEYHEEQAQELAAFLGKHSKRNKAALETTRRFLPPNIWTTSFQAFAKAAAFLPEKLIQHLWSNKILWWVRLDPKLIAKIHVADLRSKYLIQNLDMVEMRAVMACLPEAFDNDSSNEKAAWKASILDTIRSALKKEEDKTLPKNKVRNRLYFKGGALRGPFDPDAPLHSVAVTQSEAFAPTPQFIQVSRIDDNEELRNRRSSITGQSGNGSDSDSSTSQQQQQQPKAVKRQVEQFVEINSLADNPEMRRRREAFLATRIMHSSDLDTDDDDSDYGSGGGGCAVSNASSSRRHGVHHRGQTGASYAKQRNFGNDDEYDTMGYGNSRQQQQQQEQQHATVLTAGGTLSQHAGGGGQPQQQRRSQLYTDRDPPPSRAARGGQQPWAAARRHHQQQQQQQQRTDRMETLVNKYKL